MSLRKYAASIALVVASIPPATIAQEAIAVAETVPVAVPTSLPQPVPIRLTANTPVALTLNGGLTTRQTLTGTKFSMTVAQDVMADGVVVVPKGSRAIGLVTYAKKNSGFGKSGKMELAFKYIEIGGHQIPLEGSFFQEGEGNTAGTVGAVFAAGVIGGLVVKGKEVDLPAGRDFDATILKDVPFVGADGRVSVDTAFDPGVIDMSILTDKEYKAKIKAAKKAAKG